MIVPDSLRTRLADLMALVDDLRKRVEREVFEYCMARGFAYVGRTKQLESLAEKIESGRYQRLFDIDDWFACSVVVPNLAREPEVLEFLGSRFRQVRIRRRGGSSKAPDVFRFDATRFHGALDHDQQAGNELLGKLVFEVQIRSAFEHAWSTSTHALTYKSGDVAWKRMRLSAQLKAVVEQLDQLIVNFEQASTVIEDCHWAEVEDKREIVRVFRQLCDEGRIPPESAPKDWSRFADNVYEAHSKSAGWPGRPAGSEHLRESLRLLCDELRRLDDALFPRSISLFQLVFALLWERNRIRSPFRNYSAPVTDELLTLFPLVRTCESRFTFDA